MKILLIGHEASLTGAPKFLLNFCHWLVKRESDEFEVILGFKGPTYDTYKKTAKVHIWNKTIESGYRPLDILFYKLWRILFSGRHHRTIVQNVTKKRFDIILSNTSFNGKILHKLSASNVPVLSIVHELENEMKTNERRFGVKETFIRSKKIIAVSKAVKSAIVSQYKFPPEDILIKYESVPLIDTKSLLSKKQVTKSNLGISSDSFVIGGVGNFDKRKGFDLFVQTAAVILKKTNQKIDFVWVGGSQDTSKAKDLINRHCPEHVNHFHLVAKTAIPYSYFSIFNLFLMCSREDPFPLINLEIGQFGTPILSFQGSGGSPELMSMAGIDCARFLDIVHLSELALDYATSPSKCKKDGEQLRKLILDNFIFENRIEELYELLEQIRQKKS